VRYEDQDVIRFTLTAEHIKLLRRAEVGWQDCETGAPEIDPKRPYGNSSIALDVIAILGWSVPDDEDTARYREVCERALRLHGQTAVALEIVLRTGSFQPGIYTRASPYARKWWRQPVPGVDGPLAEHPPGSPTERLRRFRDRAALNLAKAVRGLAGQVEVFELAQKDLADAINDEGDEQDARHAPGSDDDGY